MKRACKNYTQENLYKRVPSNTFENKHYNEMKYIILRNFLVAIFFISIFSACDLLNNDDDPDTTDQYLLSHEKINTYLPSLIESLLKPYETEYAGISSIISKIEHGVIVYKISYKTSFNGEEIIASGLVCVPISTDEFPVLSYQNGTNTLHRNAPTVHPGYELYLLLEFISSTGFIITIPDYLGFGASDHMFHPYLDKESTVQTIVDMQRAVKELVANHLDVKMNGDYYISGYSQGGWSTMQLQKAIEEKYSDEFNLRASACSAGPYDLNYINEYVLGLEDYPMPYFLGYIFNSYTNLDARIALDDILKSPFYTRVLTLYDGTKSGTEINNELDTKVSRLFTENFIQNSTTEPKYSSLIEMLTKNSIPAWKTKTPTKLYHGTKDTFVPPMGTNKIYQEFLNLGVGASNIEKVALQGESHSSGIIPAGIESIKWFLELRDEE